VSAQRPYGAWTSPITASTVAAAALRLGQIVVDGDDVYWVEGRPEEGGRNVIVKRTADGPISDVTPRGTNVRTRVQEYGGAAYAAKSGIIYFSEFTDQRLYRLAPGGTPEPITPANDCFYADVAVDIARRRLVCVREDHRQAGREAITTIVSVPLDGPPAEGEILAAGHDFYSTPRINPDGSQVAWLAWRHPQMPWDGTELWLGDLSPEGGITGARQVAGGRDESIFQPGWSPDGILYFVSDRSGWWNLYRLRNGDFEPVCAMEAEFGRPQWQLGTATWAFAGRSRLVAACATRSRWRLLTIDVAMGTSAPVRTGVEPGEFVAATDSHAILLAGSELAPDAIVRVDLATGNTETICAAATVTIGAGYLSRPEAIGFETEHGLRAYAFYYAPANIDHVAADNERPPLIVVAHGGPTAAANARLNLEVQYFTSRGFAVAEVNYGGSTSHGREYRRRLRGKWGVVDVADCMNAAKHLVSCGKADRERLIIRGRSAGGYTTLAALTFHPGVFKAGASYYGVADLERLALDTHKFESRYLDGLVGPYPERRDLYLARSPLAHVDRLSCALIFFQGLEDRVVPPAQSQMMADAVRAKGLPVSLVTFEGEQHGFRKAESIIACLEAELFFYGAVFGFEPPGVRPQFPIANLVAAPFSGQGGRREGTPHG
jgi:dipeptidyl aminopeptidase/acylaminoacyl peptidase